MPVAQTTPSTVITERRGASTRIIINRPPLNVMDIPTLREMRAALDQCEHDGEVGLIQFSGAGDQAFSAGTEIRDHIPERAPQMLAEFHGLIGAVLQSRCLTVAVVRGHCLGGGMELALACDFILAAHSARFGQPEIKLGAFPPVAAVLLPRLIPEKRAMEMILTGEAIGAEEAAQLGLVNRVVLAGELEHGATEFCEQLLAQSPAALALARKATRLKSQAPIETGLREAERIYLEELLRTADAREGVRAFLEKRPPKWKG